MQSRKKTLTQRREDATLEKEARALARRKTKAEV
jgi:hypothetical protein